MLNWTSAAPLACNNPIKNLISVRTWIKFCLVFWTSPLWELFVINQKWFPILCRVFTYKAVTLMRNQYWFPCFSFLNLDVIWASAHSLSSDHQHYKYSHTLFIWHFFTWKPHLWNIFCESPPQSCIHFYCLYSLWFHRSVQPVILPRTLLCCYFICQ